MCNEIDLNYIGYAVLRAYGNNNKFVKLVDNNDRFECLCEVLNMDVESGSRFADELRVDYHDFQIFRQVLLSINNM